MEHDTQTTTMRILHCSSHISQSLFTRHSIYFNFPILRISEEFSSTTTRWRLSWGDYNHQVSFKRGIVWEGKLQFNWWSRVWGGTTGWVMNQLVCGFGTSGWSLHFQRIDIQTLTQQLNKWTDRPGCESSNFGCDKYIPTSFLCQHCDPISMIPKTIRSTFE